MKGRAWLIPVLVVDLLALLWGLGVCRAGTPLDGPVPPPARQLYCLTMEVDGMQYHTELTTPIRSDNKGMLRWAFLRFGQEIEVKGILSGNATMTEHGRRSVQASLDGKDYIVGAVCYVLTKYCDESCTGQGCGIQRVPSMH